jgi:hypothetical protein
MYYVNHNACATLEAAEEIVNMYRAAGVAADIVTEAEYFEELLVKSSSEVDE